MTFRTLVCRLTRSEPKRKSLHSDKYMYSELKQPRKINK